MDFLFSLIWSRIHLSCWPRSSLVAQNNFRQSTLRSVWFQSKITPKISWLNFPKKNIRYTKEKLTKYKLVLLVHILFPFMSIGRDRMQDNGGSVIIAIYRHWLRHPLACYLCFNQQDLVLSSLKNISTSKFLDIYMYVLLVWLNVGIGIRWDWNWI